MRLVLEDDSGKAWYVTEEVEILDLSSSEGREKILLMIEEAMEQMIEENEEYLDMYNLTDANKNADDDDWIPEEGGDEEAEQY